MVGEGAVPQSGNVLYIIPTNPSYLSTLNQQLPTELVPIPAPDKPVSTGVQYKWDSGDTASISKVPLIEAKDSTNINAPSVKKLNKSLNVLNNGDISLSSGLGIKYSWDNPLSGNNTSVVSVPPEILTLMNDMEQQKLQNFSSNESQLEDIVTSQPAPFKSSLPGGLGIKYSWDNPLSGNNASILTVPPELLQSMNSQNDQVLVSESNNIIPQPAPFKSSLPGGLGIKYSWDNPLSGNNASILTVPPGLLNLLNSPEISQAQLSGTQLDDIVTSQPAPFKSSLPVSTGIKYSWDNSLSGDNASILTIPPGLWNSMNFRKKSAKKINVRMKLKNKSKSIKKKSIRSNNVSNISVNMGKILGNDLKISNFPKKSKKMFKDISINPLSNFLFSPKKKDKK